MNLPASPPLAASALDALDYEAPFVIDKLLKNRIADSPEEAGRLFTEVKRFIVLVQTDDNVPWEMYSARVDEAWHQFILFTAEYMEFCDRYFGKYMSHSPHSSPAPGSGGAAVPMSFGEFRSRYEALFEEALPDTWYDAKNITPARRMFNDGIGDLSVRDKGGMVELLDDSGDVVMAVNSLARDALEFTCRTGAFHVRELPGALTDEEKTALVTVLFECGLLRLSA